MNNSRVLTSFVVLYVLIGAAACDPAARENAKRQATSKAAEARDATTQKVEEIKETVEPYIDRARSATTLAYEKGKQKAGELVEDARPYVEKARTATTQAAEKVKTAATQAVEKVRGATSRATGG